MCMSPPLRCRLPQFPHKSSKINFKEMGLQGQLNDVASDSIPLYLVALLAAFFNHLRSLLLPARLRFGSSDSDPISLIGTGLVVLSEQLSLNRVLSYTYSASPESAGPGPVSGPECVFCLSGLKDGDRVRKLSCCHVFHKDCLDGWLDQMKFSCPLCRSSSVVSHEPCAWAVSLSIGSPSDDVC